jgi:TRAP-type C4-dicarboxylate transport system permease large subunit
VPFFLLLVLTLLLVTYLPHLSLVLVGQGTGQ